MGMVPTDQARVVEGPGIVAEPGFEVVVLPVEVEIESGCELVISGRHTRMARLHTSPYQPNDDESEVQRWIVMAIWLPLVDLPGVELESLEWLDSATGGNVATSWRSSVGGSREVEIWDRVDHRWVKVSERSGAVVVEGEKARAMLDPRTRMILYRVPAEVQIQAWNQVSLPSALEAYRIRKK
jgi:hypothetical protein